MPQHVVVVGAGVIGLSCAILLQDAGYAVTIVARDFPRPFETMDPIADINYTSAWGGAHNRWVPPHANSPPSVHREHAMSLRTFAHMKALHAAAPATAGITFLPGIEYLEAPGPEYLALSAAPSTNPNPLSLPGFRLLPPSAFPPDGRVTWACTYDTWCVNPMVYAAFLLRRLALRGARLIHRDLRSPAEAFTLSPPPAAVVNASGTGLVPDPAAATVTRGQTCLVAEGCAATVTRQNADGSWVFCVPRGFDGGTVIGGTKERGDWRAAPDAAVRARMLDGFVATYPGILAPGRPRLTVVRDIVGRRPTRDGGPRVEGEVLDGAGFVMHAYGLGGRGYELSWGVAEAVVEGVGSALGRGGAKL
ncbi:nucleotide-binding domain-containing protein [Trichocladium antarcticum]|uniref:Nucleotide-binding domain-containing protein n=1 Tax=Trichocladium antarcticum TaxID=1450529 RepID=A0AAN6UH60_9PEZI|nr:nucleotide-binding domain-containing protein [Trichocladium antarcticum]